MFNRHALLVAIMALAPVLAAAQTHNNDYYQALNPQEKTLHELLLAVEKYHEPVAIDRIHTKFYSAAWSEINFILNYFPNHPRALLLMGQVCELWRDPKCNMETYFRNAIQRTPMNERVHLTEGVYFQKKGRLNEAIESYKTSLRINPDSANAHYNLGLCYVAQKQFKLANEHAQKAYALGIDLPGLRNKLEAAGAWQYGEPKPTAEATAPVESAQAKSDAAASVNLMPISAEATAVKPAGTETKNSDGSKLVPQ